MALYDPALQLFLDSFFCDFQEHRSLDLFCQRSTKLVAATIFTLLDLRCFSWASLGTWIWFSGIQQIELLLLSFQLQFHSVFEIYILVPQFVTIGTIQLASREPTTWCAALTSTGQVGHTKEVTPTTTSATVDRLGSILRSLLHQQLRDFVVDTAFSISRNRQFFTGWEIVALISRVESGNQHTCKPHKHGSCNVQFDFPWNP